VFGLGFVSSGPIGCSMTLLTVCWVLAEWDKDAKHRLKGYPAVGGPITTTAFNRNGNIFAYLVDSLLGVGGVTLAPVVADGVSEDISITVESGVHPIGPDETKPRPNTRKR
jgi:mRNA export factor